MLYDTELTEKSVDFNLANLNRFNLKGYFLRLMSMVLKSLKRNKECGTFYIVLKKTTVTKVCMNCSRGIGNLSILIKDEDTNVDDWCGHCSNTNRILFWQRTEIVSQKMYDYLYNTPWAKEILPQLLKEDKRNTKDLKGEALFFAFGFSAFSLKNGMSSAVHCDCYLRMTSKARWCWK